MHVSSINLYDNATSSRFNDSEKHKELANSQVQFMGREAIRLIPSSLPGSLEENIAKRLEIKPSRTIIKKFANGETYINILDDMRNKDVFLMLSSGIHVNDNLMELFLKADASRRMGASKVVAIMPNFPYARQERKVENGEPISASVNLALLHASGVDEVITTDVHAPAMLGFVRKMRMKELSSLRVIADYFKSILSDPKNTVVISPDLGGVKRADKLANSLGCDKAIIYKKRTGHNQAVAEMLLGDVKGKDCIIYDDIIDTAGTITEGARMLKTHGANKVYVAASHGLFNGPAIERLQAAPIQEVIVTNSEKMPITNGYNRIKQVDISEDIVGAMLDISG